MPRRLLAVALSLVLVAATTYLLRNPIPTAMHASFTALAPGISCSHPKIDVDGSLTRMELEPFECTIERGPMQRLRAESSMQIELHGLQAPLISMTQARIDWRERDISHVETNTLGDIGEAVGATDPVVKAMLDNAEMYSAHTTELRIEMLNVFRAGKQESVHHGFRHDLQGGWSHTHVRRVDAGAGPVDLRELDMRVTPTRSELAVSVF